MVYYFLQARKLSTIEGAMCYSATQTSTSVRRNSSLM